MEYLIYYDSPLGEILITADEIGLTGLSFMDEPVSSYATVNNPYLDETKRWLDIYFQGKNPKFTPKLHQTGSDFRIKVWNILKNIPYGKTVTYKEIANVLAKKMNIPKMSAQAVGGAIGHNTIPIIVPCHRVIGSDGSLTGYSGGIERKIKLLELESH